MSVTFLFDILEERLKCLGEQDQATVPLRIVYFLRFLWNLLKAFFKNRVPITHALQYDHLFIPQEHSWDCGIACCNMIRRWCDPSTEPIDARTVTTCAKPLWTIELFNLLYSSGIQVSMFTKCMGVNPANSKLKWYANAHESEQQSTEQWFERAIREKWPVYEKTLGLETLKAIVSDRNKAVIILLDVHKLVQTSRYV